LCPQHTTLSHGGIAGIIIALCLLPFMCICLIWAVVRLSSLRCVACSASHARFLSLLQMYGKKTANDVAPPRKSVGVEEVAAPVEAAPAATA